MQFVLKFWAMPNLKDKEGSGEEGRKPAPSERVPLAQIERPNRTFTPVPFYDKDHPRFVVVDNVFALSYGRDPRDRRYMALRVARETTTPIIFDKGDQSREYRPYSEDELRRRRGIFKDLFQGVGPLSDGNYLNRSRIQFYVGEDYMVHALKKTEDVLACVIASVRPHKVDVVQSSMLPEKYLEMNAVRGQGL